MQQVPDVSLISTEIGKFLAVNILAPGVEVNNETILTSIGVDSFSIIEIILFIERRFGVVLPDEVLVPDNLKSVDALARCTHRQMQAMIT